MKGTVLTATPVPTCRLSRPHLELWDFLNPDA